MQSNDDQKQSEQLRQAEKRKPGRHAKQDDLELVRLEHA